MEKSNIVEIKNSKWKLPKNVKIEDRSSSNGYYKITINGNIYTIGSGCIVNVLSLIEDHF